MSYMLATGDWGDGRDGEASPPEGMGYDAMAWDMV